MKINDEFVAAVERNLKPAKVAKRGAPTATICDECRTPFYWSSEDDACPGCGLTMRSMIDDAMLRHCTRHDY